MITHIEASLREAQSALENLLADRAALANVERAAELLVATFEHGGHVYSCGNGGSMCDAMHFAEELSGRYRNNRKGLGAIAMSDAGHLTCAANDFGYAQVFARYVEAQGRAGDCLLAISTSGTSKSIVLAAAKAKELGMRVIAMTGRPGTPLHDIADVCICTPGGAFADRVQELHIKVIHILIELVERRLFPENYAGEA
ncbi:MAG TPA: SIS domain-containing protein [Paucimonas sp.]|nr:SIS domain-containing protein [Paucimonas sp.]